MFAAKTLLVSAVAAAVLLSAPTRSLADYLAQNIPLHSDLGGPHAGMVIAEANVGGGPAVNGLLPGQVRLTFNVNPIPAYIQSGPNFGFDTVVFNTDLPITASQIAASK